MRNLTIRPRLLFGLFRLLCGVAGEFGTIYVYHPARRFLKAARIRLRSCGRSALVFLCVPVIHGAVFALRAKQAMKK